MNVFHILTMDNVPSRISWNGYRFQPRYLGKGVTMVTRCPKVMKIANVVKLIYSGFSENTTFCFGENIIRLTEPELKMKFFV